MKIKNLSSTTSRIHLKKFFILLFLFILLNTGCKLSYSDISLEDYSSDHGEIEGFSRDSYGYLIYDIENEKIVKGYNIHKEFIPASVTKVFTALFATAILGADYTFTTTLSYTGKINNGILNGDLYLKGGGDPELSLSNLQSLVISLKAKKIHEIKGKFFFDESVFNPREYLDKNMPDDAYYNAGISPLSFNSNIIYALQRKNSDGKITSVDILPSIPSFDSYLYDKNISYPFLKFKYIEGKETWGLPDKYLWDNRQKLPVKRPGLFTAQTFQKLCRIHGIKLSLPESGTTPQSSTNIYSVKSKPLSAIIKNMLFTSNNMTAELINNISSDSYYKNKPDRIIKSKGIEEFFNSNFTSIKWDNFKIINASGLTNLNSVTPVQTTAALLFIEKADIDNFRLEDILPLSGWDGTMKDRLDQPEAAFRVYGKTGSIFYASGLSGIFYAASGRKYIFTVYINDSEKRSAYDTKNEKTTEDLNLGGLWTIKAASSIDQFILKMIKEL